MGVQPGGKKAYEDAGDEARRKSHIGNGNQCGNEGDPSEERQSVRWQGKSEKQTGSKDAADENCITPHESGTFWLACTVRYTSPT